MFSCRIVGKLLGKVSNASCSSNLWSPAGLYVQMESLDRCVGSSGVWGEVAPGGGVWAAVPEGHLDGPQVCSVVVEEPCEASAKVVGSNGPELCLVGSVSRNGANQSRR